MNIPDFKRRDGKWAKTAVVEGKQYQTKSCEVWMKMRFRCNSQACHSRQPAYIGCTMSEEFEDFQFFAEWCQTQIGYGLPNYQLDKDLLKNGNTVYCKEFVGFIPQSLNKFFEVKSSTLPYGVSLCSNNSGNYQVKIMVDGKPKYLGVYPTLAEAFNTARVHKEIEAKKWAQRLEQGEFVIDPRYIERLKTWSLPCTTL